MGVSNEECICIFDATECREMLRERKRGREREIVCYQRVKGDVTEVGVYLTDIGLLFTTECGLR